MKRILAILCVLALILIASGTALAAEDNWRIGLKGDNGAGQGSGGTMHIGVSPTPPDPGDIIVANYGADITQTTIWVVGVRGDGKTYSQDIQLPGPPPKVWDLRVAALPQSTYTQIRLSFVTITPAVLPPVSVSGTPVRYMLEMVDNRGVAGAPANGTVWDVSAITTGAGFVVVPNFPMLKLSAGSHAAMLAEGYVLEFHQEPIPEPSSLLALGVGLGALVGLARRRKMA